MKEVVRCAGNTPENLAHSYAILIGKRNRKTFGRPKHGREDNNVRILDMQSPMTWTGN